MGTGDPRLIPGVGPLPASPRSAPKQPPPRSRGRERAGAASAPGTEAAPSPAAGAGTRAAAPSATSCSGGKRADPRAAPAAAPHARRTGRRSRKEVSRGPPLPEGRSEEPEAAAAPRPRPPQPRSSRPSRPPSHRARSLRRPSSGAALQGDPDPRCAGCYRGTSPGVSRPGRKVRRLAAGTPRPRPSPRLATRSLAPPRPLSPRPQPQSRLPHPGGAPGLNVAAGRAARGAGWASVSCPVPQAAVARIGGRSGRRAKPCPRAAA